MSNIKLLVLSIGALLGVVSVATFSTHFATVAAQTKRSTASISRQIVAPAVTATLTDAFPDPDGDGKAQRGAEITYTATVTNNGTTAATNVSFTNTIDANTTLVANSVQAARDFTPFVARCAFSTTSGGSGDCALSSSAYGETNAANFSIIGGQNSRLNIAATNVSYSPTTNVFEFDATVQNLIGQALGTIDNATLDAAGVRLFVNSATATTGSGAISAQNADGNQTFTAANQPYFQYNQIIQPNQTSAAKRLQFSVPNTVGSFTVDFLVSTKAAARIVINEIMANPGGAIVDNDGEYFELFNAGLFPVNLQNFKVGDNSGSTGAAPPVTITPSLTIPASGFLLFGRNNDRTKNGNLTFDFLYVTAPGSAAFQLAQGGDQVRVLSPNNVIIDEVSYGSNSAVSNIARELRDPPLDNTNVDGANWANASVNYETTNKGTPRAANMTAPAGEAATVNVLPQFGTNLVPGQTRQYTGDARDQSGNNVSTTFTWSSSNPAIATVDANGLARAVADGEVTITAIAANGTIGRAFLEVFTKSAAPEYRNHLEFGAATDSDSSNDIRLDKTQYSLSYSQQHGGPNWVSWNLNRTHFGDVPRADNFSPDESLPAGVYRVVTGDYTGSGYDRGHQVQSEQRTQTRAENDATFLTTNILPQRNNLNAGPWLDLEEHTNRLAKFENKELYNISGGIFSAQPATLLNSNGRVEIPDSTWKIVVVLPRGKGLADIASAADFQLIAVNMPNVNGIQNNPWTLYRTTVDQIEAATGYDFLHALPDNIETQVEANNSASPGESDSNIFAFESGKYSQTVVNSADKTDSSDESNAAAQITMNSAAETVSVNFGTLAPGQSATVTFRARIAGVLPAGTTQISNQGTIAGDNFTSFATDDPATSQPSDATVTLVAATATAASVNISGRVTDANGRAVGRAIVTLLDQNGAAQRASTNSFGYYRLTNVRAGETYTIAASHKTLTFAPRAVNINGDLDNYDFTAEP